MKRSQSLSLARLRKRAPSFRINVLAIAVAVLSGCERDRQIQVYSSVDDCMKNNWGYEQECLRAFAQSNLNKNYPSAEVCVAENPAFSEACQLAFKPSGATHYASIEDCENIEGIGQCDADPAINSGNRFVSARNLLTLAQILDALDVDDAIEAYVRRRHSPMSNPKVSQYSSPSSRSYSSTSSSSTTSSWKKKPASPKYTQASVTKQKTIQRGGFGSTAAAKSRWGGSSSRGGWGG